MLKIIRQNRYYWIEIFFAILLAVITLERLSQKGASMWGGIDPFFHTQRIYEIDYYFKHGQLPNWLNFLTFNHSGQAVNGMYPDLGLYLYVISTLWIKNVISQVIVIKSLILSTAFGITDYTLRKRGIAPAVAAAIAFVFVSSGFFTNIFYTQFQPNTMLIEAVAFPLLFVFSDLFQIKDFEWNLVFKISLLLIWLLFNHLVSFVVVLILVGIALLYRLFIQNRSITTQLKVLVTSGILVGMIGAPLFYRLALISASKLNSPALSGTVVYAEFITLITGSSWGTPNNMPLPALLCIILVVASGQLFRSVKLQALALMEFLILVMCSSLFPWNIFQKLPILGNFQSAPNRFGMFLGCIPLLMLVKAFPAEKVRRIFFAFMVISIGVMIGNEYNYHQAAKELPRLDAKSVNANPMHTDMFVTLGGVTNRTNLSDVPDYTPHEALTISKYGKGGALSQKTLSVLRNKNYDVHPILNGVNLKVRKAVHKKTSFLPIFGYKSLNYSVQLNGHFKKVMIKDGFVTIDSSLKKGDEIRVIAENPKLYNWLMLWSLLLIVCVLVFWRVAIEHNNERAK